MFHFYQTVTALIISSLLAPVSLAQDPDVSPFGDDVDWGHPVPAVSQEKAALSLPVLVTFEASIKPGQQGAVRDLIARHRVEHRLHQQGLVDGVLDVENSEVRPSCHNRRHGEAHPSPTRGDPRLFCTP